MTRGLVAIAFVLVFSGCSTILGLNDAVVDEPSAADSALDDAADTRVTDSTSEVADDVAKETARDAASDATDAGEAD